MEPKGSLPHLQLPVTYLHPQSDWSSICGHIPLTEDLS